MKTQNNLLIQIKKLVEHYSSYTAIQRNEDEVIIKSSYKNNHFTPTIIGALIKEGFEISFVNQEIVVYAKVTK